MTKEHASISLKERKTKERKKITEEFYIPVEKKRSDMTKMIK
jgi:hypothetical protein